MAAKETSAESAVLDPQEETSAKPTPSKRDKGNSGDYTGDNIKILEGLEAVRLRPAMYIGSTGDQGLHHLVY